MELKLIGNKNSCEFSIKTHKYPSCVLIEEGRSNE